MTAAVITEHFLPVGRLSWLCDIYIGLALWDAFGSFVSYILRSSAFAVDRSLFVQCLISWDSGVLAYSCVCVVVCYIDCACCILFSSCSAYSVSLSQGLLRFASLCGVFPLVLVRGFVRSLLVLSTLVLGGGGGGSVAIGQCCLYVWALCLGIRCFVCYGPQ